MMTISQPTRPIMTEGWHIEEEVQSFQYYTLRLLELWPEKAFISGALGSLCSFFYCDAVLFWLWITALVGDFASGVAVGLHVTHNLCYDRLRAGIAKILVYMVYILIAAIAGLAINRASGFEIPFLNLFIAYMTLTELKSILRNMDTIGFKTPPLIAAFIHRSASKIEKTVKAPDGDEEPFSDRKGPKR